MNDWLQLLKPGDTVIISSNGLYGQNVRKVEKITATQIVVGGTRYNRKTGHQCGKYSFDSSSLRKATPEVIEEIHRKNYISKLCHLDARRLRSLDTETLRAAVETLHTNAKPVE